MQCMLRECTYITHSNAAPIVCVLYHIQCRCSSINALFFFFLLHWFYPASSLHDSSVQLIITCLNVHIISSRRDWRVRMFAVCTIWTDLLCYSSIRYYSFSSLACFVFFFHSYYLYSFQFLRSINFNILLCVHLE